VVAQLHAAEHCRADVAELDRESTKSPRSARSARCALRAQAGGQRRVQRQIDVHALASTVNSSPYEPARRLRPRAAAPAAGSDGKDMVVGGLDTQAVAPGATAAIA